MEIKDLFNLSSETLEQLDLAVEAVSSVKSEETTASYGCVCCGGGWCATGIAGD